MPNGIPVEDIPTSVLSKMPRKDYAVPKRVALLARLVIVLNTNNRRDALWALKKALAYVQGYDKEDKRKK